MKKAEKRLISWLLTLSLLLGTAALPAFAAEETPEELPGEETVYELVSPGGVTYYVDAAEGNDDFAGTDEGMAWKTLERVNLMRYAPGDTILFKADGIYVGVLTPKGEGDEGFPITVGRYGEGENPVVDGFTPETPAFWTVSGLTDSEGNELVFPVIEEEPTPEQEELPDEKAEAPNQENAEMPMGAEGLPASIKTNKDTSIQKDNGGSFATSGSLNVKNADANDYNRRALIGFDLSAAAEAVEKASKIELRLLFTGKDAGGDRIFSIYDVGGEWAESAKWNDISTMSAAPLLFTSRTYTNSELVANSTILTIDLTDYVKGAGETEIGIMIAITGGTDPDHSGVYFAARENGTEGNIPALMFTYSPVDSVGAVSVRTPALEAPELPETVTVTYEDGTSATRAVTWDAIEPAAYDTAGKSFSVSGTIAGTDVRATAEITVTAALPAIASVTNPDPITAETGTPKSALGLPATVKAILSGDGAEVDAPVNWASEDYDSRVAGDYTFTGTIDTTGKDYRNYDNVPAQVTVTLVRRPDKNILAYALIKAQAAKDNGSVAALVPSMRAPFGEAFDAADAVYKDVNATRKEIQDAYMGLQTALWNLSYVPADFTALNAALARAAGTDLTKYSEDKVLAVQKAVITAKALLSYTELSAGDQSVVDAATSTLVGVLDNLDYVPPTGGGSTTPKPKPEPEKPAETKPVEELFGDVKANAWYKADVQYVVDQGLMQGAGGSFQPEVKTSRAMLVTVLYRMAGAPAQSEGGGTWYGGPMTWAKGAGITDGTNPESDLTREQIAVLLYRYAKAESKADDLSAFTDAADVSDWAKDAMAWAVSEGLLRGGDGGKLNPLGTATRAEVATLLARFAQMNEKG